MFQNFAKQTNKKKRKEQKLVLNSDKKFNQKRLFQSLIGTVTVQITI